MSPARTPDQTKPAIRRPCGGRPCHISGIGTYRPRQVITSSEIDAQLSLPSDWIQKRTGIVSRHQASDKETLVSMGSKAARSALDHAELKPSDVGCVVLATMTNTRQIPALAPALTRDLGASQAGAYDVNAACAGFSLGLTTAAGHISTGAAEHVLVVAAERLVDVVDPTDRDTAAVFADGAGAAVVSAADRAGFGPVAWGSDGTAEHLFTLERRRTQVTSTDPVLHMDGPELARRFGSQMTPLARTALIQAETTWRDISAFIPHQANERLIQRFVDELNLPNHVTVARAIRTDGNTSAASIPLAIETLLASGEAESGELALLLGFGVGMTWAAQVVRLP
ncbi:ketoacyl-ACP synthase III [Lipingzhangella sp. LS1_29]|uniref:Ketoacyl-ACP synthase III n=1 Tax=Lipingzhangella rawalii TaxID=2055835 RepID=A0ABU2H7U7_9ACTN|nr:ketoacyl-ACP synthase III [Lipingzhangella rawalii]MDS1271052.1 ketoacyl-ACP synthase III [Lipingzhangella rawalii]